MDQDKVRKWIHDLNNRVGMVLANAELMQMDGQLGCIRAGAFADLLVVDGDPLKHISLLAANGKNLRMIVRGGEVVKDELR